MKRKISSLLITLGFVFSFSAPAQAGDDWGWYRGNIYHPNEYVMNIENEAFIYIGCYAPNSSKKTYKLQIKTGKGKKAKFKTVAGGTIVTRLDKASMQVDSSYIECDDPNYPYLIVFDWQPYDWQKDYKARILEGKAVDRNFTIVMHPALKKLKPVIQY